MECFYDKERQCEVSCMAYLSAPEVTGGRPSCQLLVTAAVLADSFVKIGRSGTVHPKSATPPEVKP